MRAVVNVMDAKMSRSSMLGFTCCEGGWKSVRRVTERSEDEAGRADVGYW